MGDLNELVERLESWSSETINQWADEYEPRHAWVKQVSQAMKKWSEASDEAAAALTSLIAERDGLASLLRAFVNVRDQFPESVKLIDTAFDEFSPITVTVTKAQFLAARTALSLDTNKGDGV